MLAAAVALLILLVGQALSDVPGLLEVIASGITRIIPLDWFEAGLATFGSAAKGLLFAGVCAGVLAVGGLVGTLAARSRPVGPVGPVGRSGPVEAVRDAGRGLAIALVVLLLAELLVLPLADAGVLGLGLSSSWAALQVPLILACAAYGLVLVGMLRAGPGRAASGAASVEGGITGGASGPTRRGFLGRSLAVLGLGALGISALVVGARILGAARLGSGNGSAGASNVSTDGFAVEEPEPVTTADGSVIAGGAAGYFGPTAAATPMDRFYVVAKDLGAPDIDPVDWRLSVEGLVDRELVLGLDELRELPGVEAFRTLQCISAQVTSWDRYIGSQRWQGVRVRDVIGQAGPRADARYVLWRSADGYTESLPLEVALDEDTWLVYEMGSAGTPLPREHGGPLRVLIAGRYGMKQPKWVVALALSAADEPGYWQRRGWDDEAIVRTYSRIDWPRNGTAVPADAPFPAYGVANAGDRGIDRVEVSLDGSSWSEAELEPLDGALGPNTWRRWRTELRAPAPGALTLRARATDGLGQVQDPEPRPPLPSGATGLHAIALVAEAGVAAPLPGNHPDA